MFWLAVKCPKWHKNWLQGLDEIAKIVRRCMKMESWMPSIIEKMTQRCLRNCQLWIFWELLENGRFVGNCSILRPPTVPHLGFSICGTFGLKNGSTVPHFYYSPQLFHTSTTYTEDDNHTKLVRKRGDAHEPRCVSPPPLLFGSRSLPKSSPQQKPARVKTSM